MKRNKGITLIALIITIIILLILAVVSIRAIQGDGIFSQARKARDDYNQAQTNEIDRMSEYEALIAEKTGTGTSALNKLKEGDRVNYTYIDKEDGNKEKTIECIVLYDKTYNNTNKTNYGLQIIAKTYVSEITLGGNTFEEATESYNNGLTTLYNEAQKYLNTKYAKSARCVGSKPDDGDWDTTEYYEPILEQFNKYAVLKKGDHNGMTRDNIDYIQMNNLGNDVLILEKCYWLASRSLNSSVEYMDQANTVLGTIILSAGFHKVGPNNETLEDMRPEIFYPNGFYKNSRGFRPVFTLKDNLKIISGDGINAPYELGV